MRFSSGFEFVDLAIVLNARAAKVESLMLAAENPSKAKFTVVMTSLVGSPTDKCGSGIEYRSGT